MKALISATKRFFGLDGLFGLPPDVKELVAKPRGTGHTVAHGKRMAHKARNVKRNKASVRRARA